MSFIKRKIDQKIAWLKNHGINFNYNDKFIYSLKNKHKGKRCFILGNGPSLKIKDLDKVHNEITLAANKIYLSYPLTRWRPSYYFVEDNLVIKQNHGVIDGLEGYPKLFPRVALEWAPEVKDGCYYNFISEPIDDKFPSFGENPFDCFYWGSTVIYSMVQFAFYMGCNPIYLIGVDFYFELPKKPPSGAELECEGEINHFHKDYRQKGEKWNVPNLDVQIKTFRRIKSVAKKNGIYVYNATRGGKLEVFERVDFDEMFVK